MAIEVQNEELVSPRDLAREYPKQFRRLQKGEVEKLVIMRKGEMEAVVLRSEDYERLLAK